VALGIQVFFILRELRRAVAKANKILEDTGIITESVSTPLATLSTLMMGVKTGISAASLLKNVSKFGEKKIEDKNDGELKSDDSLSEDKKPLIRRFFKGASRKSNL
jgi:hypothetical protein